VNKVVKHNHVKDPSSEAEYLNLYLTLNFVNFNFYLFINMYSSQLINFIRCIYKFFDFYF
jgi:hypothetical protein